MDVSAWGLYLFLVAAVLAAVVLNYRRREPPGRGRLALAGLRAVALAILVLLLFDPVLPTGQGGRGGTVALVDASLSMRLADEAGASRWDEALDTLARLGADRVLLFGAGDARPAAAPDRAAPDEPATRLAPALRAALEAEPARVVVLTDGAVEDAVEVRRLLAGSAGRAELRVVGGRPAGNVGITAVDVPRWLETGEEATVGVSVAALGAVPDSAEVVLRREGRELARSRVATAPEGRLATARLRFTPVEGSTEPVRLEVALEASDAEPADDRRTVYVRISAEPSGVALVTFRPDQEPRFLMPVLERALGIPVRGWMALPGGRYIRLGTGTDAGATADEAAVRRALGDADLVVLHGLDETSPIWALGAAARGRVLAFPLAGVDGLGVPVRPLRPGDWYVAPDPPASPVAPLLAGAETGDAPPLTGLRPAGVEAGSWAPLDVRLARRGEPRPALVAREAGGRRVAVALGEGYWRWAFAGGAGRDLYDRFWSAVAGWLMEGSPEGGADAVRPIRAVVARGEPVTWTVPGGADSLRVVLRRVPAEPGGEAAETPPGEARAGDPGVGGRTGREGGATSMDTTVVVAGGSGRTPPLPPGRYRYEARTWSVAGAGGGRDADTAGTAPGSGTGSSTGAGELTAEPYSPEYTRPAVALSPAGGRPSRAGAGAASEGRPGPVRDRTGRPLHTTPWPYLAVVALLSLEWILRRRWGLR